MATYPGNVSLSSAVKDRVLSTFQQALALYKKARALDSEHPAISRVAESLAAPQPAAGFTSGPSPSFVVEAPPPAAPAAGRGAAQAADFGFTFEEDKPAADEPAFGAFSFDTP